MAEGTILANSAARQRAPIISRNQRLLRRAPSSRRLVWYHSGIHVMVLAAVASVILATTVSSFQELQRMRQKNSPLIQPNLFPRTARSEITACRQGRMQSSNIMIVHALPFLRKSGSGKLDKNSTCLESIDETDGFENNENDEEDRIDRNDEKKEEKKRNILFGENRPSRQGLVANAKAKAARQLVVAKLATIHPRTRKRIQKATKATSSSTSSLDQTNLDPSTERSRFLSPLSLFRRKRRDNDSENGGDGKNNNIADPSKPQLMVASDAYQFRDLIYRQQIPLKEILFNYSTVPMSDNENDGNTNNNVNGTMPEQTINATMATTEQLKNHAVMKLIEDRVRSGSTPGNRAQNDTAHLALSIEGGGMRGAVSAGMAAAIASLGLTDAVDSVYGSSAGAIVGAYLVSRQMCIDVYTEVLPAAKGRFASSARVMGNLGVGMVSDLWSRKVRGSGSGFSKNQDGIDGDVVASVTAAASDNAFASTKDETIEEPDEAEDSIKKSNRRHHRKWRRRLRWRRKKISSALSRRVGAPLHNSKPALWLGQLASTFREPGMNVTFILDGIMSEQHGLRPFDLESFRINNARQPLYVIASTVRGGKRNPIHSGIVDDEGAMLETVAFNADQGDYWDIVVLEENEETLREKASKYDGADKRSSAILKRLWIRLRKQKLLTVAQMRAYGMLDGNEKQNDPRQTPTCNYEKKDNKAASIQPAKTQKGGQPLGFMPGLPSAEWRAVREIDIKPDDGDSKDIDDTLPAMNDGEINNKKPRTKKIITKKLLKATASPPDDKSNKVGLFACLETSMLVPGAAGPPVKLLRGIHRDKAHKLGADEMTSTCFDAFCYEPIPYRCAVENGGATHVLALRTRPDGCLIETVPTVYEKLVAPVYFRLNGLPRLAQFFERGGAQWRYLEDILTLDEGLTAGCLNGSSPGFHGVPVPPTDIYFGTDRDSEMDVDTDSWKRAHLFPVMLPAGTQELPSLTQDKGEVLLAVRNGYAAAFDVLAPLANLDFDPASVDSMRVAELLFPRREDEDMFVLENRVQVKGEVIENSMNNNIDDDDDEEQKTRQRFINWIMKKRRVRQNQKTGEGSRNPLRAAAVEVEQKSPGTKQYVKNGSLDWLEAEALLAALPGFQEGKLSHLSTGLRSDNVTNEETEETIGATEQKVEG